MADLWQSAADGMFALLNPAYTDPSVLVRQELPENPKSGTYVLIADMDGVAAGGKFEVGDKLTVDVHFVYRGPNGRRGLRALMWAGRCALQNQIMTGIAGVAFSPLAWLEGSTAVTTDGTTYVGVHQFEVTVEPA